MREKIEKVMTLCLAFLLVVIATVSGTLAYETLSARQWAEKLTADGDFVEVELVTQQRDGNGRLESFEDGQQIIPLVGSAQYDGTNFDKFGMPTAEGYVDQIVQVQNTGTVSAYVRVIVAVPAALDNANDAGHSALHWNLGNRFMADGTFGQNGKTENEAFADIKWEHTQTAVVEGVQCNIYVFTYQNALPAGGTTAAAAFTGFYLDRDVNIVDGHVMLDGADTGFTDENITVRVKAQAIQAAGFESAAAAFGTGTLPDNPWQ